MPLDLSLTQTAPTASPSATGRAPGPVRLVILEGADAGREYLLEQGTAVVGTRADCALVLQDPRVSRQHAAIELCAPRLRVTDLGSKNGTRYLGGRIQTLEVPVGSALQLGDTLLALLPPRLDRAALSERTELGGLVGRSPAMRRLYAELERAGPTDAAVLLQGETGTGKEAAARALHQLSDRAAGPFRVFDCGATSPELFADALFGHVRGAFTGAVSDQPGALAGADGGTLFLDELGELPLAVQPSLLRALSTRTYTPLGATRTSASDFRVIAASHRDLASEAGGATFRRDLYYRLAALTVHLPPLRERREDIPVLVEHFSRLLAPGAPPLPPTTVAVLCAFGWPGNVRELKNAVERAQVLGLEALLPGQAAPADFHQARELSVGAFERSYLEALLEQCGGSIVEAARRAGLARSYVYRLMEQHGVKPRRKK